MVTLTGGRRKKKKATDWELESNSSSQISTDSLEETRENLKQNMHKKSTRSNYHQIWTKFNRFIIKLDRLPDKWEERTSLYCTYLIDKGEVQSSTIKSYVSAIKTKLKLDGYRWDNELIYFNALTKSCKLKNDILVSRLPILYQFLQCLLFEIERKFLIKPNRDNQYMDCLYKAAFMLMYYGLLRVGEVSKSIHVIKACDVHVGGQGDKILVILHSSKTHGKSDIPQEVKIMKDDRMKHFCPVAEIWRFAQLRKPWCHRTEQFFIHANGSPLLAEELRHMLRELIRGLKLEAHLYDTHSFRIGRATDLRKQGYSVEMIKQIGRWKSNAVYKYLRGFPI